ncbi:MAG TPA: FAD-binding oxidoreductase [Candidatus Acidoferrales bacterium]
MCAMKSHESWGRYPKSEPARIVDLSWASDLPDLNRLPRPLLPYGKGRSYGDCCLNDGGTLLDVSGLDRFIRFDPETGLLRCEAGVTLKTILELIVPANWFLPVTPGTQIVTVGGAIANDVHGKNHHRAGSFGRHLQGFELLRSDRGKVLCSRECNRDLFEATIGGLGLTGLILWAEFQLKRILGPLIDCEKLRFESLEEFFELSTSSDKKCEYTVAWLDCMSSANKRGRGIFIRGNHSTVLLKDSAGRRAVPTLRGFNTPASLIRRPTIRAFNWVYLHTQWRHSTRSTVHYENFFYPLDRVADWNRFYGRSGFLQYQFVVPYERREGVTEILDLMAQSREVCSLSILKVFGEIESPGLLSFPRPGVTLTLDFPFQGESTLHLCEQFDQVVQKYGGAVYPAKDARMSAKSFQRYFPRWREFSSFVDPSFGSDFWRRVATPLAVSQ